MTSIYFQTEYVQVSCGRDDCGEHFAMSRSTYDETRRTGRTWYCPSGHRRVWKGPTTEQQLRDAEARERHLTDQLHAAEADAEQSRVRLAWARYRFANGVCPCCNRTFDNVRRHMETKHPDYAQENGAAMSAGRSERFGCSCGRTFATPHGLAVHQGKSRGDNWSDPRTWRWERHLTVAVTS